MSDAYLHGAYGRTNSAGSRVANASRAAIVYVGTAPVHELALASGESYNVNKPVLVNNIAEARKAFGYSDDWAKFTLCEAMHAHFEVNGVGPLVLINVLDPATHKSETQTTVSKTPVNGVITIADAESVILETVVVQTNDSTPVTKEKGVDYSIAYNIDKKTITITELTAGALGTAALSIKYYEVDATAVSATAVIGASDGLGENTGLYAIKDVYQVTGYIPAYLVCPGFSSAKAVHDVMYAISQKINKHWDAYLFTDLPLVDNSTQITLNNAATWKAANGFNKVNETVSFPMIAGTDQRNYHLSVLRAANFQSLLLEQDGIPYRTPSNTECTLIKNLYMGESYTGRVFDDSLINEKLNKNGIASAAYVGGRWALWGAHSADYDQNNADYVNVAETNRMMLYYISNDFQHRRSLDVDKPMTRNDLETIVAEEQARLDGLKGMGALLYGEVRLNADELTDSDVMNGDFSFTFEATTTPLAKSLTAIVNWTDAGFVTYFAEMTA